MPACARRLHVARHPLHPPGPPSAPTPNDEMEALLHLLRELPDGCPEQRRAEGRLAQLVRPHLVRAAAAVAREWKVPAEDLEQEGLLATCRAWQDFTPGRVPGRCLYPAYVLQLGKQAMVRAATAERSAVHVTRHARRKLARAKKAARDEGLPLDAALRAQGLDEASVLTLGDGSIRTTSLEGLLAGAAAEGDGPGANAEARLGLVDTTAARLAHVAQREAALGVLYRLPRLQRVVVQALAGFGRAGGLESTERTVAQEMRLPVARVRRLHAQGLKKLRVALDALGHGPELPARSAGTVRRQRAAAPRDARPRPVGQGAQLGLALTALES
ncbi:hypothetical protein OV208_18485 [Corallococcus sp. bb12-1]|uniref:sigma factor n=1 Tax=Corallococcus sp. bb12-1 TaxID=2996784 RepID=UPI00226FCF0A|nr:sigma factor [Corallococcus sp. bb12-1]MCY1043311.1 hypothetical protein [Corallococcus sp. bb12-1]